MTEGGDRREAIEAARDAVEAHEGRKDRWAVHLARTLADVKDLADRLDQRLEEWPDPPSSTSRLRDGVRAEVGRLETRLDDVLADVAPNLVHLLGANLAGMLLSEAGGLPELAQMPTSRVQVLGAKRAVLRAKQGAPSPKHGVLFLDPRVGGADPDDRGDAAERLASQASLAARADAFTGRDLTDELVPADR